MNAKQFAKRLMDDGHFTDAWVAGRYAALRSAMLCSNTRAVVCAAPSPESAKLFAAIDACDDGEALEELAAFIEPEFVNWGEEIDIAA